MNLNLISLRKGITMINVPELFGSKCFNEAVMKQRLPADTYKALSSDNIKYDVVDSYQHLLDLVRE